MKVQNIIFILTVLLLLLKKDARWMAAAGLVSVILAIPFFSAWIFFTAERLTWYAAGFFVLSILLHLYYAKR